ncbi:MAG: SAM hydrolase/SAM-dependent halogenase family protein [Syntrophobacteraceae bacterium]
MASPVITLLSDFGLQDQYVGIMKGVILQICPAARLVDICHLIGPQEIRSAAFLLYASHTYFPPGTIHLAVVDPDVGTDRRAVVLKAGGCFFVGPDNGLFSLILKGKTDWEARVLENEQLRRNPVSSTFHGRDIFAPAAAHLAAGVSFENFGAPCGLISTSWGEPALGKDTIEGEVIHIDRFGNAVTNVDIAILQKRAPARSWTVRTAGVSVLLAKTYAMVKPGEALGLAGSAGFIEIAINRGNAASKLGLRPGTPVKFRLLNPSG